jgi:hypothetical protein
MACWMKRSSTRDAEFAHPATTLRNELPFYRRGLVRPREQLLAERGPVSTQVVGKLLHRHPVDAGTTLVFPHSFQRGLKIAAFAHQLHQVARS